tara:strand:+ start:3547 stop:4770 length:1224 start_codon:yes stop_codon:yes gene_type:complete
MRPKSFSLDQNKILNLEEVNLEDLASSRATPFYVYTKKEILENCDSYANAINKKGLVCYSVKANSNLSILNIIKDKGLGFDVVSGGELQRVLKIGADPKKIVFSGVGKTLEEINLAASQEIFSINVESHIELNLIKKLKSKPRISFRVNPDISANSHPYIETGKADCKFGISEREVLQLAKENSPESINLIGISAHIGSQIKDLKIYMELIDKLVELAKEISSLGHKIDHIDVGGGLAIDYELEESFNPKELVEMLTAKCEGYSLVMEPGRSLIAQTGALITKVIGIKENGHQKFLIVDAGMNDLIRPSLYSARHKIENVNQIKENEDTYSIVGPVCETADSFGENYKISANFGDYLVIYSCGAYGSSMGSNYNSRFRPAEILISEKIVKEIRREENFDDLISLEEV